MDSIPVGTIFTNLLYWHLFQLDLSTWFPLLDVADLVPGKSFHGPASIAILWSYWQCAYNGTVIHHQTLLSPLDLFPGNSLRQRLDSYFMELLAMSYQRKQPTCHQHHFLTRFPGNLPRLYLDSYYIMELLAGSQSGTVPFPPTPIISHPLPPFFQGFTSPPPQPLC